jgi:hypothetical protein
MQKLQRNHHGKQLARSRTLLQWQVPEQLRDSCPFHIRKCFPSPKHVAQHSRTSVRGPTKKKSKITMVPKIW